VKAAQALVSALGVDKKLTFAPPMMSNHNKRRAIDMKTTWPVGPITIKNGHGKDIVISSGPHDGLNAKLMAVGQSHGVTHFCHSTCGKKTPRDDPNHWSVDGH